MTLIVKPRAYIRILLFIILVAGISIRFTKVPKTPADKIADHYIHQLAVLYNEIAFFKKATVSQASKHQLQSYFFKARSRFKDIAWIIEYFNPYENKLLNGAALKRTEEDNPHVIYDPEGFQVIEEILFGEWDAKSRRKLIVQLDKMLINLTRLKNEPDLRYKFSDAPIMMALKAMIIRLASMGMSGFDSPVALNSLPEAQSVLASLLFNIEQYKTVIDKTQFSQINKRIRQAKIYLSQFKTFNSLNRLEFLRLYLDPVYSSLSKIGLPFISGSSPGRMPVNYHVTSLFDSQLLDPDFFAPNQRYQPTADRIMLGKQLFYDVMLSGNNTRSCASCHKPEKAFTDGSRTALSIDDKTLLTRNTPTLWNSVFQTRQFYDSRTATLENQLSAVVHNTDEMQGSLQQIIPVLKTHEIYNNAFQKAYRNDKEPISQYNIANAIASFIRSLIALNSKFDHYMRGDTKALNVAEKNGFNLFMGKAKCGTCHYFPLFNGLVPPSFTETESEVLGVPASAEKSSPLDPDPGKFSFTNSPVHKFAFKTPTLRNIALTAPYMHNGVYNTLEEVMDFYNKGGGSGLGIAPETQTLPPVKLNLTKKEIGDIISFMKCLTDTVVTKRQKKNITIK